MAWVNYGWAWNVFGVQGSEYVVLLYLSNEASGAGVTPELKIQKIMQNCNLNRRSVFRCLKGLETKGFVTRKHEWAVDGSQDANTFIIDRKRFFPKNGSDEKGLQMWKKIIADMEDYVDRRIDLFDMRTLRQIREVVFQQNTKTIYLVVEAEFYADVIVKKDVLRLLKETAVSLKLPIRRFEAYRKPFLKN